MSGQGQGHGRSVSLSSVKPFETDTRPLPTGVPPAIPPATADGRTSVATVQIPLKTVTLSPTEPESRKIGLPQNLPAPVSGVQDMEAGEWCDFIMTAPFPFSVALLGHKLKGRLLGRLLVMPGVNEPVLRPGWRVDWDARRFFTRINSALANVEAVVIQCVGVVITDPERMCVTCSAKNGPFAFCVTVAGVEECANCHWDKEEHRCSFNMNPLTPKSRRSSKLYTVEEITEFGKEIEDLRMEKADLNAQMMAFRKLLEAAGTRSRTALRSNPERANPPLPAGDRAIRQGEYRRDLEGPWLWDMDLHIREMQTAFGLVRDKANEIIERQDVLTNL